jgi:hypothetical protein
MEREQIKKKTNKTKTKTKNNKQNNHYRYNGYKQWIGHLAIGAIGKITAECTRRLIKLK